MIMSIVWLASYPKSGNTWLRTLLTNYCSDDTTPKSINDLLGQPIASDRYLFDEFVGVPSSDLTPAEIRYYQPLFHELLSNDMEYPHFVKTHSANVHNAKGIPIFSGYNNARAIYIVRNPLDVAVSYAHHGNKTVDHIIECMCDNSFAISASLDSIYYQLPEALLSWSQHVLSWTEQTVIPVYTLRYEDMLNEPLTRFQKLIDYVELKQDEDRLIASIEFSRFEVLSHQEKAYGFVEKQPTAESFFRRGESGSWHKLLTSAQRNAVIDQHGDVMAKFGYI